VRGSAIGAEDPRLPAPKPAIPGLTKEQKMQLLPKAYLAIIVIGLALATPLSAQSPALAIADGQAWTASMPNGDIVQMSFLPDGTVRAKRGLFRIRMAWTPTEDGMCITGGPDGDRCMTLQPDGAGYVAISEDQVVLTLTR
jgi:hypothetical protein